MMRDTDFAALIEYEQLQICRQAIQQLVGEGKLEMVGRLADGEPVYRGTECLPTSYRARLLNRVRILLLLPAFVAEYTLGYAAFAMGRVFGPTATGMGLVIIADGLHHWREANDSANDTVWLSIKY
jgi:hypothetical protein